MEVAFIVAIVAGGLYALLFLIALGLYIYNRSKEHELGRTITQMYNDKNLAKMEYDFATYDPQTARMVSASRADGQLTFDDVIIDNAMSPQDEGMEEITGNYKPD